MPDVERAPAGVDPTPEAPVLYVDIDPMVAAHFGQFALSAKPTVESLGIDVSAQDWQRSGTGNGNIEVAVVGSAATEWVLMRICGDPAGRVLVYDRNEWECFLDGVRGGEFDAAAS